MSHKLDYKQSIYQLYDYDKLDDKDIDTENFTKLDGVEIIKSEIENNHPFLFFLRGFSHGLWDYEIIHAWFHTDSKIAKFYINNSSKFGSLITNAWREYISSDASHRDDTENEEDEEVEVYIYTRYCGELYDSNEYDPNSRDFYKNLVSRLMDKI